MTKSDMVAKLADKCDLSQAQASDIINCIFSTDDGEGIIAIALDAGDRVSITGFGTFETRRRKARKGRNPATGEEIQIPAATVPAFKAGKGLKDRVAD